MPVVVPSNLPPRLGPRKSGPVAPRYIVPNQAGPSTVTIEERTAGEKELTGEGWAYVGKHPRWRPGLPDAPPPSPPRHSHRGSLYIGLPPPFSRTLGSTHSSDTRSAQKSIMVNSSTRLERSKATTNRRVTFSPRTLQSTNQRRAREPRLSDPGILLGAASSPPTTFRPKPKPKPVHASAQISNSSSQDVESTSASNFPKELLGASPHQKLVNKGGPSVPIKLVKMTETASTPKKRGRPKGSKNKPRPGLSPPTLHAQESNAKPKYLQPKNDLSVEGIQGVNENAPRERRKLGRPKGSKNKATIARERKTEDSNMLGKRKAQDQQAHGGWTLNLDTLQWERDPSQPPLESRVESRHSSPATGWQLSPALFAKARQYEPMTEYQSESQAFEAVTQAFDAYREAYVRALHTSPEHGGSDTGTATHCSEKISFGGSWVVVADPNSFSSGLEMLSDDLQEMTMEVVSVSGAPAVIDHNAIIYRIAQPSETVVCVTGQCQCSLSITVPESATPAAPCEGLIIVTAIEESTTELAAMMSALRYTVVVVH